jgi:hypothetical protein
MRQYYQRTIVWWTLTKMMAMVLGLLLRLQVKLAGLPLTWPS